MKKLTAQEWNDRMTAMAEAQRIFIDSGMTNNITVAFAMYQAVLADKERPLTLSSKEQEADKTPSFGPPVISMPVDVELEKPKCPDCDSDMTLRDSTDEEKLEGFRSVWLCPNCKYEGQSEKSVMRWIRELPEKGAEVVEVEGNSKAEDLP